MEYTKTFKYKLRLTPQQETQIDVWINTCRAVYNLALETKIYAYKSHGISLSKFDLMSQLPDLKTEHTWVKEVSSQTLQDVIERMDTAYQSFFRGGGHPKFARKDRYNSITFKSIKVDTHNRVILPKIGSVKYFNSRELTGELRRATITRTNNNYFISIITKQERKTISLNHDSQVGIDVGLAFFASLSNGTQIDNPRHTKKYEKQLRIESRSLARKVKGSNNRRKQRLVVAKLHDKISRTRKDFLHKQSTEIINQYGVIAIEDLKVKNMVKFGNLAKHINDASWSNFRTMLGYKADWYGNTLIAVNPRYTSQTCNTCGTVDKMSRVSQSKFVCTECGCESNADVNAAKNILGRAMSNLRERKAVA